MKKELYNTPIQSLNYSINNNKLFIKRDDLIPFSFGGNKVRIATQYFQDIRKKGSNCIITYGGDKSNLNRVIANMSKVYGLDCFILVSTNHQVKNYSNNLKILKELQVKITLCENANIDEIIQATMDRCIKKGLVPYYVYGDKYGKGNEKVALEAYVEAYDEISVYEKINGYFDYIFHASGTGITQSGLVCGKLIHADNKKIIGISIARKKEIGESIIIDNVSNYLNQNILRDMVDFEDDYLCGGYGQYNKEIIQTIKQILISDGIPLDTTYTGKAFWGMLNYLKREKIFNAKILFIHTGGIPLFFDDLELFEKVV